MFHSFFAITGGLGSISIVDDQHKRGRDRDREEEEEKKEFVGFD